MHARVKHTSSHLIIPSEQTHFFLHSTFIQVPAAPPLSKNVTLAPPTPPALPKTTPTHSPQRPRSLPSYNQHVQAVEDNDKGNGLQLYVS